MRKKRPKCIYSEGEGVVVTRKSRLRWCLWCSGSSERGSITPPIKGSSTLHLMAACGWCHLRRIALQISHDAKHGVQNILSEVSESRKVTDASMNERLQGNSFICVLSFKKVHCFTRVTVVCKELKEWVCQVVGKDHFIPLSIRQREAPILTLLMLEVTSFPNPFKVGWWNEPPKNKSQIGGRFCLKLGMIEMGKHVF